MGKLIFKPEEVAVLVRHSKGRAHPGKDAYVNPQGHSEYLFIVHDDGVYLMSGATEILPNPKKKKGRSAPASLVAYAEGCNPADEDCWENSRALVGGDDFGEAIPLQQFERVLALNPTGIFLNMTPKRIIIGYTGR